MSSHPKSRINIELDDDPTIGLKQSVSLPGRGAGGSSTRDVKDVLSSTTGDIKIQASPLGGGDDADSPEPPDVIPPPREIDIGGEAITPNEFLVVEPLPGGGVNLTDSRTGDPAKGWVNVPGMGLLRADQITPEIFEGIVGRTQATQGTPAFPGLPPGGGTPSFPEDGEPGGEDTLPSFDDILKGIADIGGFDFGAFSTSDLRTQFDEELDKLLSTPSADFLPSLQSFLSTNSSLLASPSQILTGAFLATVDPDTAKQLRDAGVEEVIIGQAKIVDAFGELVTEFVFINPLTGQPILGPGSTFTVGGVEQLTPGRPLIAPRGQELFDAQSAIRSSLLDLNKEEVGRLSAAEIAERQARIVSLLEEKRALGLEAFRQFGSEQKSRLDAALGFISASGLSAQGAAQQAAAQEDAQRFTQGVEEFRAQNQFALSTLQFQQQQFLREMELAWLNGSPEEARAARLQAQSIANRQIQLQERELLISTLAVLGQHPQLRGLIKALGIFEGGGGVGGLDLEAFFSGEVPPSEIPSAQEFSLMTPVQQENLINDLAGKFGVSPEIIVTTIRRSAPRGTRRLV